MRPLAPALLALALAGCLGAPAPSPAAPASIAAPEAEPPLDPITFTNLTGTLLALPLVGGEARFAVQVPEGAAWAAAALKWPTRGTLLSLELLDPVGQPQGEVRPVDPSGPPPARRLDAWVASPAAGPWTAVVRGEAALQEPLALQWHTLPRAAAPMHAAEALRVAEGAFAEVNMDMNAGQAFRYTWSSAEPLYFNIHTHRNGETINLVENTTAAGEGTFASDEDGIYSLLWEVQSDAPVATNPRTVALGYRVDGDFELHSIVG